MTQHTFRKHIFFVFFGFFCFYFLFIDNFLKEFSKKCWVTALVRSMTFIGSINYFRKLHQSYLLLCLQGFCYKKAFWAFSYINIQTVRQGNYLSKVVLIVLYGQVPFCMLRFVCVSRNTSTCTIKWNNIIIIYSAIDWDLLFFWI